MTMAEATSIGSASAPSASSSHTDAIRRNEILKTLEIRLLSLIDKHEGRIAARRAMRLFPRTDLETNLAALGMDFGKAVADFMPSISVVRDRTDESSDAAAANDKNDAAGCWRLVRSSDSSRSMVKDNPKTAIPDNNALPKLTKSEQEMLPVRLNAPPSTKNDGHNLPVAMQTSTLQHKRTSTLNEPLLPEKKIRRVSTQPEQPMSLPTRDDDGATAAVKTADTGTGTGTGQLSTSHRLRFVTEDGKPVDFGRLTQSFSQPMPSSNIDCGGGIEATKSGNEEPVLEKMSCSDKPSSELPMAARTTTMTTEQPSVQAKPPALLTRLATTNLKSANVAKTAVGESCKVVRKCADGTNKETTTANGKTATAPICRGVLTNASNIERRAAARPISGTTTAGTLQNNVAPQAESRSCTSASEQFKELCPNDALLSQQTAVSNEASALLALLSDDLAKDLEGVTDQLSDIVLDLGCRPVAWVAGRYKLLGSANRVVASTEIARIVRSLGSGTAAFGKDNRAGLERELHRISAIRNRQKDIIGLTLRVGRHISGCAAMIADLLFRSAESILFLGKPGSGKTTVIREVARLLADQSDTNVCIVDTSNEIAGAGNIPHPCVGLARRMMVPSLDEQGDVMIECVQNHTPSVMVIDEIGRPKEVDAARTCKHRGVRLIASAHGDLRNLVKNQALRGLIGRVQNVTLGDKQAEHEAKRHNAPGISKTKAQRTGDPTFGIIVELSRKDLHSWRVVRDPGGAVDCILDGQLYCVERRSRDPMSGRIQIASEHA